MVTGSRCPRVCRTFKIKGACASRMVSEPGWGCRQETYEVVYLVGCVRRDVGCPASAGVAAAGPLNHHELEGPYILRTSHKTGSPATISPVPISDPSRLLPKLDTSTAAAHTTNSAGNTGYPHIR